jgi:hypothetical protein
MEQLKIIFKSIVSNDIPTIEKLFVLSFDTLDNTNIIVIEKIKFKRYFPLISFTYKGINVYIIGKYYYQFVNGILLELFIGDSKYIKTYNLIVEDSIPKFRYVFNTCDIKFYDDLNYLSSSDLNEDRLIEYYNSVKNKFWNYSINGL